MSSAMLRGHRHSCSPTADGQRSPQNSPSKSFGTKHKVPSQPNKRQRCLPLPLPPRLTNATQLAGQIDVHCSASSRDTDGIEEMTWDVLGIGQSMVDFSATVDDQFLEEIGVEKGGRRIISLDERTKILERLQSSNYQIRAGGSLANTLANLARLGHSTSGQQLRISAFSISGTDMLGSFHQSEQSKAGVQTLSTPLPNSATGTVIVLTTPDANRTFLSYLGTSQELAVDDALKASIRQSRLVALEGYIWEMPNASSAIAQVIEEASKCGTTVAMTAGDANVMIRHRDEVWSALKSGVDIFFANKGEAQALLGHPCSADDAALVMGPHCSMAIVTDGPDGSRISAMGHLQVVPPHWIDTKPVDTCGAGDAYAAGLLYGWLNNMDASSMGRSGARVASAIISKHGAALNLEESAALVDSLSTMPCRPSFVKSSC